MANLSKESQVWLDKYFQDISVYASSGMKDLKALENAARSLEFLLQRAPEQSAFIQRLSLQAAMFSRNQGSPDLVIRMARNGLEAGAVPLPDGRSAPEIVNQMLLLVSIESRLEGGRRSEGIQELKKLKDSISDRPNPTAIGQWVAANQQYQSARLNEEILEYSKAYDFYRQSVGFLKPLMLDPVLKEEFQQDWTELCYGEEMKGNGTPGDDIYLFPDLESRKIYGHSCYGMIRCQKKIDKKEEQEENARETVLAMETFGMPPGLDPFNLISLLSYLPEKAGRAHAEWVSNTGLPQMLMPPGLSSLLENENTRELGEKVLQDIGTEQDKQALNWEVAARLGIASSMIKEGRISDAGSLAFEAQKLAGKKSGSIAGVMSSGFLTVMCHVHPSKQEKSYADYFLQAFSYAVYLNPGYWNQTYYRSLFEEPLSVVLEFLIRDYVLSTGPVTSTKASILLDATRTRQSPDFLLFLKSFADIPGTGKFVDRALDFASDSLGRIMASMQGKTLVLIIQPLTTGTGFLLLSRHTGKPVWATAGKEYREAVDNLQETVRLSLKEMQVVTQSENAGVVQAGEKLFSSLPPEVQFAIQDHDALFIIPDFTADAGVVPFELMMYEKSFLGLQKIISRFISVFHLATVLDSPQPRLHRTRAIITAIDQPGLLEADRLQAAEQECESIRGLLSNVKYEIPETDMQKLNPSYYVDRLSFVDVLHIAAHGEAMEGDEWLLLPNDVRFFVDDLDLKKQRSFPFIYLNTCHLGRTRYLGAGISRGFAFNLIEYGSPALIANTIETLDAQTARLSVGFYRRALSMPLGKALLETRKDLFAKGISPVIWGSAVLFGNPDHRLPNGTNPESEKKQTNWAVDLLDAYLGTSIQKTEPAWKMATLMLQQPGYKPKLEAAVLLLLGMQEYGQIDVQEKDLLSEKLIRLADKLNHFPSRTILRMIAFRTLISSGKFQEAYRASDELMLFLEAISPLDSKWKDLLMEVQADKKRLELQFENRTPRVYGPQSEEADDVLQSALDAIYASQESNKSLKGEVEIRIVKTKDDMAWNAVLLGRGGKMEDARETMVFAKQYVNTLIENGGLRKECLRDAPVLMAAMLRYLWFDQNVAYLDPDIAEGQTATLQAFIQDIHERWIKPDDQPWFQKISVFSAAIDRQLAHLDSLSWEDIYKDLDDCFAGLQQQGLQLLETLQAEFLSVFPLCSAYVSGLTIEKNTYSYADGSVPEALQKKMESLYNSLTRDQEDHLQNYLQKGYEKIQNRPADELETWTHQDNSFSPQEGTQTGTR